MKLLRINVLILALIAFVLTCLPNSAASSKELPARSIVPTKGLYNLPCAPSLTLPSKYLINRNKLQADNITFTIIDSLANAYSYYSNNQQPFIYNKETNQLITVKRGYVDTEKEPNYTGTDTKENLFFRYSVDWGANWSNPELIYDEKIEKWGNARYPSCYSFFVDGELTLIYTAPINKGEDWVGFVSGLYIPGSNSPVYSPSLNTDLKLNGKSYAWGTDSKILGGIDNKGEAYGIGIGGIMPPENLLDGTDNHNIAYRRTENFGDWAVYVPPATSNEKFRIITEEKYFKNRFNSVANMRFGDNNKIYTGILGPYLNSEENDKNELGFTVSEDYGKTWSEINICPLSIVKDYAATLPGVYSDSCAIFSAEMTAFENGDLSFVCQITEGISDTTNIKKYDDQLHGIVEIYYESGIWGIRPISDVSGWVITYADPLPTGQSPRNQMGIELQLARSVDGKSLICKWVDFVDAIDSLGNIRKRFTNDIFVSTRAAGTNKWSEPKNITESYDLDRVTWLPDLVPDNFKGIPLLTTKTMWPDGASDVEKRNRQSYLEQKQWVMIGHFDLEPASTEQENPVSTNLEITSIYPNPADDVTYINVNTNSNGNTKVELFDLLGRKMMDVYEGSLNNGLQSITANVKGLMAGTYYCVVSTNGQKSVKTLTIVR